jgi:hypothetical protein
MVVLANNIETHTVSLEIFVLSASSLQASRIRKA